jgi:hypothetical protein
MIDLFAAIGLMQAAQLVDSTLPTTRQFWRAKLGYPDLVCRDPRPLADIIAEIEAAGRQPEAEQ